MAEALQSADDIKAAALNALGDSATPPTPSDGTQGEPPAPPAESAGKQEPAPKADPEPPVPNPDEPKEGDKDWKVPGERLQDEVKKRKDAEAKAEQERVKREEAEAKLEAANKTEPGDDPDPDDEDDDVELKKGVKKAIEKEGFVRADKVDEIVEAKIAAREAKVEQAQQAKQDVASLTDWAKDKGYPEFNIKEVLPVAKEMFGENLNQKQLRTAYLEKYGDEIEDVLVKKAQATASAPSASAERSGGSPGVKGEPAPGNVKDKTKAAISAAIPD